MLSFVLFEIRVCSYITFWMNLRFQDTQKCVVDMSPRVCGGISYFKTQLCLKHSGVQECRPRNGSEHDAVCRGFLQGRLQKGRPNYSDLIKLSKLSVRF